MSNRVSGSQALLSRKQNFHCLYSLISKVLIPTEVSQIEALHLQIHLNAKSTSQVAGVSSAEPELPLNGAERKIVFKTQAPAPRIQQHLCSYSFQIHSSQGTYQLFPDSTFLFNSGGSSAGALLCVPAAAYQDRCVVSAAGIATEFEHPQQEEGQAKVSGSVLELKLP